MTSLYYKKKLEIFKVTVPETATKPAENPSEYHNKCHLKLVLRATLHF